MTKFWRALFQYRRMHRRITNQRMQLDALNSAVRFYSKLVSKYIQAQQSAGGDNR